MEEEFPHPRCLRRLSTFHLHPVLVLERHSWKRFKESLRVLNEPEKVFETSLTNMGRSNQRVLKSRDKSRTNFE